MLVFCAAKERPQQLALVSETEKRFSKKEKDQLRFWKSNSHGLMPVCFLKAVEKWEIEE